MTAAPILRALRSPIAASREPLRLAEAFRKCHHEIDGHATIVRWARAWWLYDGVRFVELDDELLRRRLWAFLDVVTVEERDEDGTTSIERVTATRGRVSEVQEALTKVMPAPGPNMPQWIARQEDDPSPDDLVACANGLLDMRRLRLLRPTPRLFTTVALGAAWDPDAPAPRAWLDFLSSIWPDDPLSIRCLQQIFGYLLTADTSQQKLFALIGPARSGKGTIGRVLRALIGEDSVVNPTLASLERPFGLAPFVGKLLAVIGDARLGGRGDQAQVVERLLSISGEDALNVDRKNRDPINVRLRARVLLISNELPRLYDTSGALASRFVLLVCKRSFLGSEDTSLERRLLAELPAILRWAIEGRQDLAEEGRFVTSAASSEAIRDLEEIGSPVLAFVREKCRLGNDRWIEIDALYEQYAAWCETVGRKADHKNGFARDMRACVPDLEVENRRQPGQSDARKRVYRGIDLA